NAAAQAAAITAAAAAPSPIRRAAWCAGADKAPSSWESFRRSGVIAVVRGVCGGRFAGPADGDFLSRHDRPPGLPAGPSRHRRGPERTPRHR
ncbi:MAG: hypothetical protein AAGJ97_08935, partial [Planctomycetota bacterium]